MTSTHTYYKVAEPDGFDFHTGRTINYRENIGKTVKVPNKSKNHELCSGTVLHASREFFDALKFGKIPCSIFVIHGKPVVEYNDKCGFVELKIKKEIDITNWKNAYYSTMIYILNDVKNNFDNEKFNDTTKAIDQTISVFRDAQKTDRVDMTAARTADTAWIAARAADTAWIADAAAMTAARAADDTAWIADAAARAADAADAAWIAARYDRSVRDAKFHEYSEKFIELLEAKT